MNLKSYWIDRDQQMILLRAYTAVLLGILTVALMNGKKIIAAVYPDSAGSWLTAFFIIVIFCGGAMILSPAAICAEIRNWKLKKGLYIVSTVNSCLGTLFFLLMFVIEKNDISENLHRTRAEEANFYFFVLLLIFYLATLIVPVALKKAKRYYEK